MGQHDAPVWIGVAHLDLHLPEARSLKEKRAETRPLVERIRRRHHALIVEAGYQDLHQRARFVITVLSTSPVDAESRIQRIRSTVDETWPGPVLEWEVESVVLD